MIAVLRVLQRSRVRDREIGTAPGDRRARARRAAAIRPPATYW